MKKPRYHVGQVIVGRVHHLGDVMKGETVMVEIDSARYDSLYGHWIYCGSVWHIDNDSQQVEIYESDIEYKVRRAK